ncbi:hypothetical protein QWY84_06655 [Aquisalimonas lutea]|uniref:DUF6933 domain-containing protein n=1 Tax=Aquisalimonas lutea TaxID=1327750 RepID=UPI0025B4F225|nr:hypothetical protein [Aquisalimonas lutea]MDN3517280.1 hypothetical protein [Aquisalimonas lutea]
MQLLKCTKKLRKEAQIGKADLTVDAPDPSLLGSWHANLIHIGGRKCVLFVNDTTLTNFLAPDARRVDIRRLGDLFRSYLAPVLVDLGITDAVRQRIMAEYEDMAFANTDSRRILGSANDFAFHYELAIRSAGGVQSPSVPGIIRKMNEMPMSALQYRYPVDALHTLCQPSR